MALLNAAKARISGIEKKNVASKKAGEISINGENRMAASSGENRRKTSKAAAKEGVSGRENHQKKKNIERRAKSEKGG